jgi:hypothetical protein
MKKIKKGQLIFACSIFLIYSCNLYEKEERLLVSYAISNEKKVNIYYIDMGATTKEVIQIRLSKINKNDSVIMNIEKNYLQSSKLLNDTTLLVVLKDTGSIKLDTSIVKIGGVLK